MIVLSYKTEEKGTQDEYRERERWRRRGGGGERETLSDCVHAGMAGEEHTLFCE